MISNVCAFLLCGFALTSNIKTIESAGNKIYPLRLFVPLTPVNYLRAINKVNTFNKRPKIVITQADEGLLSTNVIGSIEVYHLKLKSRDKLEKKARDIICSFCVIAQSNILQLRNLVEKIKNGEPFINNENIIKRIKQEAEMIVKLYSVGYLQMGKWLWSYFLKIIAVRQYDDNKDFIHENPFEDLQLQTDVSDFIGNCIADKYLPPTALEPDFVSKNMDMNDNMFTDLIGSEWFKSTSFDCNYDSMIELLYLKPFWYDEKMLLFEQPYLNQAVNVNVDWRKVRQRYWHEVFITKKFVENRDWIHKPYDRLHHQHLLTKIIDARIYMYISVILYVYEKQLPVLDDRTLEDIRVHIYNVMVKALYFSIKDEFLVDITSEFQFLTIRDVDDIKGILARVTAKAYDILNDLNGEKTNKIDWLSINVNEEQLSTNMLIRLIIADFKYYLNGFISYCLPFAYRVILHFMDVVKFSAARYM